MLAAKSYNSLWMHFLCILYAIVLVYFAAIINYVRLKQTHLESQWHN
jgi:hypothetical protein